MVADRSTRIERALREQLETGCAAGVFPGASACVAHYAGAWQRLDACVGFRAAGADRATPDTIYDLASLTKPFVATAALRLHQAGIFPLNERVDALIPEAKGRPIGARRWEDVLSHRSGLQPWEPFYERITAEPGSETTWTWVLAQLLPRYDPAIVGTAVYSDLGYILAGLAMQRAARAPLDRVVAQQVTMPLGLDDQAFFGATRDDVEWKAVCATTGWSRWRRRLLVGEVHDDNCAALGGVAGHAGMFGTARGVASFGAACIGAWHGRRGALEEESIHHAMLERPGGSHRLGWDGRAEEGSAAGSLIDRRAFGHLGFTGTSIWCDPIRQIVIVLLTNRVAVSDDNAAIRAFRPTFHDGVIAAYEGD